MAFEASCFLGTCQGSFKLFEFNIPIILNFINWKLNISLLKRFNKMRKLLTITTIILVGIVSNINAQTLGAKKNITLKLMSYECGDPFCYVELKDVTSGVIYGFDNIDEKTKHNGIIKSIQDVYYKSGESDKKLIGKIYNAVIEYRKTDIWKESESAEEPPIKTGKKKSSWMINTLSK